MSLPKTEAVILNKVKDLRLPLYLWNFWDTTRVEPAVNLITVNLITYVL